MKKFFNEVAYHIIYSAAYIFSLLPISILYVFSSTFYFLAYRVFGYRKSVVLQNLTLSFPEKQHSEIQQIGKRFYQSFAAYFAEIFKSVSMSPKKLSKKVDFVGFELVQNYINQGKNVIASVGHCGNWEMLNVLPLAVNFDVYAIYKPLQNKMFDRMMIRLRSRFNVQLVPSNSAARHMLTQRGKPIMYMFLADQCPLHVDEKYRITFLNQKTSMFPGVEKLARATDSVVVYMNITKISKGHYKIECKLVCDNAKQTQETEIIKEYARLLEENIREQPSGWLWSHKRWKR